MKRLLFPFVSLYERLNLRQRWWHRLAIVIFFVVVLAVAALTVIVVALQLPDASSNYDRHQALLRSFSQLEPPEDSTTSIDFDFVQLPPPRTIKASAAPNGFDWNKYPAHNGLDCYDEQGNLQVDEAAAFGGVTTGCGKGLSKPKSERMNAPRARLRYVEQAEACQKRVVADYAKGDVQVYRSKMDECLTAEPNVKEDREEEFTDVVPIKSVFKQDMETNPKAQKVRVPKVGVVAFPVEFQEKEVEHVCGLLYNRAASVERRAQATMIAYALAVLIAVFYVLQVGYRLLLYVVFGGSR